MALLTNFVPPYRLPVYNALAERFALHVLLSGFESNRGGWEHYQRQLRAASVKRAAGLTIRYAAARGSRAVDARFLHVNPGYLLDLLRVRPHAVVSNELGVRTLLALLYCALARVPLWVMWEGNAHTEHGVGGARRAVRRLIVRRADRWISWGRSATAYLRTLGVPDSRIVQVQNCVDEGAFARPAAPAALPGPRPVLLVVSRLMPGKGVALLLDAVADLRAAGLTFTVVIVGDGAERDALLRQRDALKLDNVHFELARAPEEMPAYYRGADALVLPTLDDAWGLVVNEALWSGLPVLASKFAGCASELLPAAQLFDPTDRDDFVRKLRAVIEHGLPPADTSPLVPIRAVAETIARDIERTLCERAGRTG